MNNVNCYRNSKLKIMCNDINVILTYLLSYFLNYNFIKILFAIFKIYIRKNIQFNESYTSKLENFSCFLKNVVNIVQKKFFAHKNKKKNFDNLFKLIDVSCL